MQKTASDLQQRWCATLGLNLEPKCSSPIRCHHLFKTFYAGPAGWTEQQLPDGTIVWTAPSGRTYTTPLLSVSREYHNSDETHSKRGWTHWDAIGPFAQVSAGLQPNPRTHLDALRRPESTSQAEYAGSIPVIGSTLNWADAVRTVQLAGLGVTGCHKSI